MDRKVWVLYRPAIMLYQSFGCFGECCWCMEDGIISELAKWSSTSSTKICFSPSHNSTWPSMWVFLHRQSSMTGMCPFIIWPSPASLLWLEQFCNKMLITYTKELHPFTKRSHLKPCTLSWANRNTCPICIEQTNIFTAYSLRYIL